MDIVQAAPLSVIIVGAVLGLLTFYYLMRFFAQSSVRTKTFFLFYFLFPLLVLTVVFRGFTNLTEVVEATDYVLIAKYLGSYWLAISVLFLLEKIFQGTSFYYGMMIILALVALILTPHFAPQILEQFMEILNEQLATLEIKNP